MKLDSMGKDSVCGEPRRICQADSPTNTAATRPRVARAAGAKSSRRTTRSQIFHEITPMASDEARWKVNRPT